MARTVAKFKSAEVIVAQSCDEATVQSASPPNLACEGGALLSCASHHARHAFGTGWQRPDTSRSMHNPRLLERASSMPTVTECHAKMAS
eukprot:scaffold22131_cov30-Tisochrysis_lutea.AAC.6